MRAGAASNLPPPIPVVLHTDIMRPVVSMVAFAIIDRSDTSDMVMWDGVVRALEVTLVIFNFPNLGSRTIPLIELDVGAIRFITVFHVNHLVARWIRNGSSVFIELPLLSMRPILVPQLNVASIVARSMIIIDGFVALDINDGTVRSPFEDLCSTVIGCPELNVGARMTITPINVQCLTRMHINDGELMLRLALVTVLEEFMLAFAIIKRFDTSNVAFWNRVVRALEVALLFLAIRDALSILFEVPIVTTAIVKPAKLQN